MGFDLTSLREVPKARRSNLQYVVGLLRDIKASLAMTLLILLTSCAPAVQPVVVEPPSELSPTPTISPITEPASTLSPPLPTATQNPCDPFVVDFCITDGYFVFQNPIYPPGNTFVDTTYRYGTTQNGTREPHHGVEFLNRFGTPVHAAGDGVVQFAGPY